MLTVKYKTIFIILIVIFIALIFAVCFLFSKQGRYKSAPVSQNTTKIERVICINPAATETIFALGAENKLIAVSDFCNYPPQAKNLPSIGGVINPNLERISALKPDLVIVQGKSEKIVNFCQKTNIRTLRLDMWNIAGFFEDVKLLGQKLDCSQQAQQLCLNIQNELAEIKNSVADRPKPKVFLSLYRMTGSMMEISTAGPDTLLNELVEIAGGKNVFDDAKTSYPKISKESLLKRAPDIIIEPVPEELFTEKVREKKLDDWKSLEELPAVKNGRICFPDADIILKPSPRITQAAALFAAFIHPEITRE